MTLSRPPHLSPEEVDELIDSTLKFSTVVRGDIVYHSARRKRMVGEEYYEPTSTIANKIISLKDDNTFYESYPEDEQGYATVNLLYGYVYSAGTINNDEIESILDRVCGIGSRVVVDSEEEDVLD